MTSLHFPRVAAGIDLLPGLRRILDGGFEELDGAVLLACFHDSALRAAALVSDLTAFEAFVNHVHVEDYLPDDATQDAVLDQASEFVRQLVRRLATAYPDQEFQIIAALSDSLTIRFHASRSGVSWLAKDLEGYRDEAVMCLITAG